VDIGKAYLFVKDEEGWIGKIAIGAIIMLFSFLIIPIFLLVGYQIAVARNVLNGEEHPMPAWDDWGQLFMDGIVVSIAQFIYALPVVLLSLCSWLVFLVPAVGAGNDLEALLASGATIGFLAAMCVIILLSLALAFLVPALYVQYVRTGDFGSMFRFGEVFELARQNLADILLTILANIGAGLVLGVLITIASITICGGIILSFAGPVWLMVATAHLYGQIAANVEGKGKEEAAFAA
jgi:hypothetical protein